MQERLDAELLAQSELSEGSEGRQHRSRREQREHCVSHVLIGIAVAGALILVAACAFAASGTVSAVGRPWLLSASTPQEDRATASAYSQSSSSSSFSTSSSTSSDLSQPAPASRQRCEAYLGRPVTRDVSLILTADPGDFSGVSEAHYIVENLRKRRDARRDETVCGGYSSGTLMGQPVLVVTTGIGPAAASLCTFEVVSNCGPWIKEAIYFGTSGWSPQPGGILNPPQCSATNWRPNVTRTGDICISPFSVNWTCKKSSWSVQAAGGSNQCMRPEEEAGPADTPLFGECMFYADNILENLDLADDLAAVARSAAAARNFPPRSSAVAEHERLYWSTMAEGAAQPMPVLDPVSPPTVWDYTQCMEVDGQFFYSGSPWELKARDYAAATLTAAWDLLAAGAANDSQGQADDSSGGRHRRQARPAAVTAADMIAVSAMEGVGVSEALLRYHALSTTRRPIPFTNVRTLSNWMIQPIVQSQPGVWEVLREVPEDFVNGYAHAIATGSATILSLYQHRCLRDLGLEGTSTTDAASKACSFVIDTAKMLP